MIKMIESKALQQNFLTRFGEGMIADEDITIDRQTLTLEGAANTIDLPQVNPYQDMTE